MLEIVHGTFILTNEMSNEREFSREFETSSPYDKFSLYLINVFNSTVMLIFLRFKEMYNVKMKQEITRVNKIFFIFLLTLGNNREL